MPVMHRGRLLVAGIVAGIVLGMAIAALIAVAITGIGHAPAQVDAASTAHWQVKYVSSAGRLSSAIAGIPADCRVEITQGDNNDYYVAFGCPSG